MKIRKLVVSNWEKEYRDSPESGKEDALGRNQQRPLEDQQQGAS